MKTILTLLTSALFSASSAYARLPDIEGMKEDEKITVSRTVNQGHSVHMWIFEHGSCTIIKNGKQLGKLVITEEEAEKIDNYLQTIEQAKGQGKSFHHAPIYKISHKKMAVRLVNGGMK